MRLSKVILTNLAIIVTGATPASAVDTTKVYNSGLLVLLFLGLCALIIVIQLIPAILIMIGSIRSMVKEMAQKGRIQSRAKS